MAAKKRASGEQRAFTDPDTGQEMDPYEVPEDVQDAANRYVSAMRSEEKAAEKTADAKKEVMAAFKAHNVNKCKVDNGKKWLIFTTKEGVRTEAVKKSEIKQAEV